MGRAHPTGLNQEWFRLGRENQLSLADDIKAAVRDGRFVVSVHARERMAQRGVRLWQIESGLEQGTIEKIRPDSEPCPSIVVRELLPDGIDVTVVWSWLASESKAKLVTVYFPK